MPNFALPQQPRLGYRYRLDIDGITTAYVEAVQLPTPQVEMVEHASGGQAYVEKTAGGYSIDDLSLDMIMPASDTDTWACDKLQAACQPAISQVGSPSDYLFDATIHHLDGSNNILESWVCRGCWVRSVSFGKNDALDKSSKMMLNLTIVVHYLERL